MSEAEVVDISAVVIVAVDQEKTSVNTDGELVVSTSTSTKRYRASDDYNG